MSNLDRKTAPAIKGFGSLNIPKPRTTTLDNGIPLTIIDNGSQEVNRISLIWDGGICETHHPSIASLTANLLREGTKQHTGAEIAETFEYNGAWVKSNIHSHHSSVIIHSLNSRTENVLPILAETITAPSFPVQATSVLREKMARTAELDLEKVEFHSANANRKLLFGVNHPLANSDTASQIRNIKTQDIYDYHNKVYRTDTCGIYLAGRITPKIEDLINDYFGQINNPNGCQLNVVDFAPTTTKEKIIDRQGSLQSSLRLSIPTINRQHPDYADLRIAVMALGGYFGSRLMANIREDKGYTYGISASLLGYKEGGIMSIATQCDNQYVSALIEEVKKEIIRMTTSDFSDDELSILKHYAMTQLASSLDSPFTIMDYYENMRLAATPSNYFESQINAINNISSEKIGTLVKTHLPLENLYISIAGDASKM